MTVSTFRTYCRDQERRVKDFLARLGRKAQPREEDRRKGKDGSDPLLKCYHRSETMRGSNGR